MNFMNIHLSSYGEGTPLVFFHGWGFDSQIWLSLLPYFEKNYQLILVDLPGFGQTRLQDWITFKINLLAQLPQEFILCGWSLGGLYATRLAIEESNRVVSLINITSSPRFIADASWPGVPKEVFIKFHQNLTVDIKRTLIEFMSLQCNKKISQCEPGIIPSKEGLQSGLNILDSWDLRPGLKQLTIPACFMFGRLDPITPINTMNKMQDLYPDFNYVLFNKAAHMPFLSHPDLFIEQFLEFIE